MDLTVQEMKKIDAFSMLKLKLAQKPVFLFIDSAF